MGVGIGDVFLIDGHFLYAHVADGIAKRLFGGCGLIAALELL